MMVNIRGLKSKEHSLNEIIQENRPTILMIMETLSEDETELAGYTTTPPIKKRSDRWGGIIFAVRNEFTNQVQIKSEHTETAEIEFIQMTCGREIVTIGLVYAPQENQTSVEEMDKMYAYIEEEITKARISKHVIIIGGDFNCKIGDAVVGNRKEVSKGGRRLLKLAKNNGMKIMNTAEKCQGIWTRIQVEKGKPIKTVIDYIMISEEHEAYVTSMKIDEDKQNTPFRDDSVAGKPIYTDHNMITMDLNLVVRRSREGEKISRKKNRQVN